MLFKKSTYNCWLLHNQNDFCIVCWLPDDIVQKSGAKIVGFLLITNSLHLQFSGKNDSTDRE